MVLETCSEQLDAVGHHHVEQRHREQAPKVALQQPGEPGVSSLRWPELHAGGVLPGPHIAIRGRVRGQGEGGAPRQPDTSLHN